MEPRRHAMLALFVVFIVVTVILGLYLGLYEPNIEVFLTAKGPLATK